MTGLTPFADRQNDRHDARSVPAAAGMQALPLRVSVLPAVVIAVLSIGIVAFLLARGTPAATIRLVLAEAAVILLAAIYTAIAATRQVHRQIRAVRSLTARGQAELQQLVERIKGGEQPAPSITAPLPVIH